MNLVPIKNYEELYSFDLNSNQVYSHKSNKYISIFTTTSGYFQTRFKANNIEKKKYLHRLIYEAYKGEIPTGLCIDHIDGNKQNNNIDNLRLATISDNTCNRKIQKNNKSTGYKNITKTICNNYQIRINKNHKVVYNKTFKTLEEAITNRDIQLKLFHKEFHNLG